MLKQLSGSRLLSFLHQWRPEPLAAVLRNRDAGVITNSATGDSSVCVCHTVTQPLRPSQPAVRVCVFFKKGSTILKIATKQ